MARDIIIKQYQQQYQPQNIISDQAWPSVTATKRLIRPGAAKQLIALYGLGPSDKARINVPPVVINPRKKKVKNRLQVRFEISQAPNPIRFKESSSFWSYIPQVKGFLNPYTLLSQCPAQSVRESCTRQEPPKNRTRNRPDGCTPISVNVSRTMSICLSFRLITCATHT